MYLPAHMKTKRLDAVKTYAIYKIEFILRLCNR